MGRVGGASAGSRRMPSSMPSQSTHAANAGHRYMQRLGPHMHEISKGSRGAKSEDEQPPLHILSHPREVALFSGAPDARRPKCSRAQEALLLLLLLLQPYATAQRQAPRTSRQRRHAGCQYRTFSLGLGPAVAVWVLVQGEQRQ